MKNLTRFNLLLAIGIILWGAWVRLTGSGAGCGEHWPLCNGEVIPLEPSIKTLIEFIHRFTSGLFGITVFVSWLWAKRLDNRLLSRSISCTLLFTIIEALIGAFLVKKGLVVDNDSALRAIVISLHLINTLGLLYFLVQNCCLAMPGHISAKMKPFVSSNKLFYIIFFLFLGVGGSGAIAALGNTLFPETSLLEGIAKDFDPTSHFLIQLRIIHPVLAILLSVLLFFYANQFEGYTSKWLKTLNIVAVFWGAMNWLLLAPNWGSVLHLALSDILFCLFCLREFESRIYPVT